MPLNHTSRVASIPCRSVEQLLHKFLDIASDTFLDEGAANAPAGCDEFFALGDFLTHEVTMPDATAWHAGRYKAVRVIKTEEKGSDVNLATHLLMDAMDDLFDVAIIISNDSDLKEPIAQVSRRFGKKIGILVPQGSRISRALLPLAHFIKRIRPGALAMAQFPNQMTDAVGQFQKPPNW